MLLETAPAQRGTSVLRIQLREYISEVRSCMSLDRQPLLRYCLFDAARAGEQRLVLIFNHLVCDGISSRILWRELSRTYRRLSSGEILASECSTSYQDFAEELFSKNRQLLKQSAAPESVERDKGLLDKLTQGLSCTTTLAEVVRRERLLSIDELSALRSCAAGLGVGLSDFLLTCWICALGQTQVDGTVTLLLWVSPHFVGDWSTPVGELVGSVSFPLPVTFSMSDECSFADAVKRVSEELQAGLAGAEVFAARYFATGSPGTWPMLPSIGFNYVSDQRPSPWLIGYELAPEGVRIERLQEEPFDLALGLEIEIYGQEMQVSLCATPSVAERLPIDGLFDQLLDLLMMSFKEATPSH
ncbi:condensation domain-containing protein [Pseudomonas serbica]